MALIAKEDDKPICGIVMPISEIDGCDEAHWSDVLDIITESLENAGFTGDLVSNADDAGIIHKRIIQNLYDNALVVCDVSGKNPNVMFELGLRLAFDKPTIIIKDDMTSYSFDTSAIEHMEYPRDLRFGKIVDFKKKLSAKLKATYEKSKNDPDYTTFLKHFGQFKVAKLEKTEVSGQEYIIDELRGLRRAVSRLDRRGAMISDHAWIEEPISSHSDFNVCMGSSSKSEVLELKSKLRARDDVTKLMIEELGEDHEHLLFDILPGANIEEISELTEKYGAKSRSRKRLAAAQRKAMSSLKKSES